MYTDDFFPPSPCPQDENSDTPIRLVEKYIAKWKKSCLINGANDCVTLALPSASLECSDDDDDESDSCVTPTSSCSSSVYSQDEFDLDRHLEYLASTKRSSLESCVTDSTNNCATPTLSASSSVYSQDERQEERVETDTRGYYELPWVAGYFNEYQHSIDKGLEENVEKTAV